MLAASGYDLFRARHSMDLSAHQWSLLAVGFAVSFVVALGVVAWFMGWVRRHGFVPFAVYRMALGMAVLLLLAMQVC